METDPKYIHLHLIAPSLLNPCIEPSHQAIGSVNLHHYSEWGIEAMQNPDFTAGMFPRISLLKVPSSSLHTSTLIFSFQIHFPCYASVPTWYSYVFSALHRLSMNLFTCPLSIVIGSFLTSPRTMLSPTIGISSTHRFQALSLFKKLTCFSWPHRLKDALASFVVTKSVLLLTSFSLGYNIISLLP